MEIVAKINDLPLFHPELLWLPFQLALGTVMERSVGWETVIPIEVDVSFASFESMELVLDGEGLARMDLRKIQKSYEPHRLVEMAAIGLAALALYYACGYRINDIGPYGSGADYLVEEEYSLEVAGRSRRVDFNSAWREKWNFLQNTLQSGFFLFVAEFETPAGKLAFAQALGGE